MNPNERFSLAGASEVDYFSDLTEKNLSNFRHYKLVEFPNKEYGITVTQFKQERIDKRDVLRTLNESLVAYGPQNSISGLFEEIRQDFVLKKGDIYEKLLQKSVRNLQL